MYVYILVLCGCMTLYTCLRVHVGDGLRGRDGSREIGRGEKSLSIAAILLLLASSRILTDSDIS